MKKFFSFITPILQYVIAALLLAIILGAWKVYADVQDVKLKIKGVADLTNEVRAVRAEVQTIPGKFDQLKTNIEAVEKRVDRRLADVPLCRRR